MFNRVDLYCLHLIRSNIIKNCNKLSNLARNCNNSQDIFKFSFGHKEAKGFIFHSGDIQAPLSPCTLWTIYGGPYSCKKTKVP